MDLNSLCNRTFLYLLNGGFLSSLSIFNLEPLEKSQGIYEGKAKQNKYVKDIRFLLIINPHLKK